MTPEEPLQGYPDLDDAARLGRIEAFEAAVRTRRTVRQFADIPVPRSIIEAALLVAARAPSGANVEPWSFVAVADPTVKRRIREAAEAEERAFYGGRAAAAWPDALRPFGTDAEKPFLERAPWSLCSRNHTLTRTTAVGGRTTT